MKLHNALTCAAIAALSAIATGCGKSAPQQQQLPPPEVGVVVAKSETIPLTQDLVGRLSAFRSADVRARVPGVLLKRAYVEGSDVKEGDMLFRIDPAPYQAALNSQLANLAAAQATYENDHIAAERARAIGARKLLSQSDVDNANAAERTSAAAVKQAKANVETARINLGYTSVVAPISGRAGQQQVTEGALVGQTEATLLTTVEQIDPIYVNFSQAVGQLDEIRRDAAAGHVRLTEPNKARIDLLGGDGATMGEPGTLDFSDKAVDPSTGAVTLRGVAPNSDHALLPGQYVNVRLTLGELTHAWLIPQAAVQRDSNGAYVLVVGSDGNVALKRIETSTTRGGNWIVTGGIEDGDQVVVSGVMKVKPGSPAKASPWQAEPPADGAKAAEKH